jgi:hypothetical protein
MGIFSFDLFLKSHGAEGAPLIREADRGGTLYDSRF